MFVLQADNCLARPAAAPQRAQRPQPAANGRLNFRTRICSTSGSDLRAGITQPATAEAPNLPSSSAAAHAAASASSDPLLAGPFTGTAGTAAPEPLDQSQQPLQQQQQQQQQMLQRPPDPAHMRLVPGFLDAGQAELLRVAYEERMLLDPLRPEAARASWDSFLMPQQLGHAMCLHRTPAERFFPPSLHDGLRRALEEYGERELGCSSISPLTLSYYTEHCRHSWHCAATSGPFAFALSLTRWQERRFGGGEIMLLQQPSPFETDETTLIDPEFNLLVIWDSHIPYGVREVTGTDDPLEARVALQGWFHPPTRSIRGSLSEAQAGARLDACQLGVHADVAALDMPPVSGTVVVRLEVSGLSGCVTGMRWLVNTLSAPPPISSRQGRSASPWEVVDAVLGVLGSRCAALRLPPSTDGGGTTITLPFTFA